MRIASNRSSISVQAFGRRPLQMKASGSPRHQRIVRHPVFSELRQKGIPFANAFAAARYQIERADDAMQFTRRTGFRVKPEELEEVRFIADRCASFFPALELEALVDRVFEMREKLDLPTLQDPLALAAVLAKILSETAHDPEASDHDTLEVYVESIFCGGSGFGLLSLPLVYAKLIDEFEKEGVEDRRNCFHSQAFRTRFFLLIPDFLSRSLESYVFRIKKEIFEAKMDLAAVKNPIDFLQKFKVVVPVNASSDTLAQLVLHQVLRQHRATIISLVLEALRRGPGLESISILERAFGKISPPQRYLTESEASRFKPGKRGPKAIEHAVQERWYTKDFYETAVFLLEKSLSNQMQLLHFLYEKMAD